jgi:predicted transcriptional regulator
VTVALQHHQPDKPCVTPVASGFQIDLGVEKVNGVLAGACLPVAMWYSINGRSVVNRKALEKLFSEVGRNLSKGILAEPIPVRRLLAVLDVSRRGANVNALINKLLDDNELVIEPNFEWEYVDNTVQIKSRKEASAPFENQIDYRVNSLKSANKVPLSVNPDDELAKATTIMTAHNFSQLPVMINERTVKGIITWKSIAEKILINQQNGKVRDYMIRAVILYDDTSMFEAIHKIKESDYVLVRNAKDEIIKGIVTSSDLSEQFGSFAEPFLLVGKCELLIRRLIYGVYSMEDLQAVVNRIDENREIRSVHDLTFGEYVRLLENRRNWAKLGIALDRSYFIRKLSVVRDIRNDIMHFDPNASNLDQVEEIRSLNRITDMALKEKETT